MEKTSPPVESLTDGFSISPADSHSMAKSLPFIVGGRNSARFWRVCAAPRCPSKERAPGGLGF